MRPFLSEFCVIVSFLVSSSLVPVLVLVVLVEVLMLDTRAAPAVRADSDNTRSMRLCPHYFLAGFWTALYLLPSIPSPDWYPYRLGEL